MKQKITFLLVMMCLFSISTYAQTQFWSDTFESNPSSGTRVPEVNGGTTSSYFRLTDGSNISQVVPFTGKEGNSFWAGEDHNGPGTGFPSEGATPASNPLNELQIEWTGINISGKSGLSFSGLLAAASTNEPWDNQNACVSGVGTTNTDYIIIEYSIDGGTYANLIRFYNRGSASGTNDKYLFEDTNNDGCGDGIQLTNAFGEFTKTILGTGTTMNLRIRVFSEGNNEEWGIDNFRLFEAPVCNVALTLNSQTNVSCNGGSNGTATVNTATGGTAPYTYDWTPGNPTGDGTTSVSGLTAGTWTCTVTDANSCTASQVFTITQPVAVVNGTTVVTNVACNGGTNGAINLTPTGGTPPYTYNWGGGITTEDRTGLAAGSYSVTITDANGCTGTVSGITITQPAAAVSGTTVVTNVACNGGTNGAINLTPSGGTPPYTYNWGGGITTEDRTGLAAGSYSVTITDANGCTGTVSGITITQPAALVATAIVDNNVSCNDGNNGGATGSSIGGTPPYTYLWSNGSTAASLTGVTAGTYNVTITDANGCTDNASITIAQPTALVATAIVDNNVSCNDGNNGGATGSAIGGTPPYTYLWSNASTTASLTGVTAGTYNVTITDANGCADNASITITEPVAIDNTISELTTGILTANEVSATSYQWYECPNTLLTGETNQTFEPTALGDYKVEITVGTCVAESACYTVNALDTSSFVNKASFVVYPNPSNGLLHIDSSFDGDFVIVNQLGQTVTSFKVNAGIENTINVENITDGVYFIKGTSGTQISSQRLLIKK